ncbi:O-methyltransferase [Xylariaceae sp. FL0255]|nr:O-methyltransferase [Xylariaceae sp. FL0255]
MATVAYPQPTSDSRLLGLAADIERQTAQVVAYLKANDLPEPSFEETSPETPLTKEYLSLHSNLVSSLDDFRKLVDGPRISLGSTFFMGADCAAFQTALEFDFFRLIPLKAGIHVRGLAAKAGMDEDRAARVLRMLATHRVFQEVEPEYFSHTAASALVNQDEGIRSLGCMSMDEILKAGASTADCIKKSPYESDSVHSPFATAMGVPLFQYYSTRPQQGARFAKGMSGIASLDRPVNELKLGFSWDRVKGKVVDVGGGSGHVSMALARDFPNLQFVVQDSMISSLKEGERIITPDISDRVSFEQYDFFTPQPQRDVAVFLIRHCIHNWSDNDAVRILRAFVPGLEGSAPGTPLLLNDTIMPKAGTLPRHEERRNRQFDIMMLQVLGSKQRTREEFATILRKADPRLEIKRVYTDGATGVLEVHLDKGEA